MITIVLDTNVLISAVVFAGNPRAALERVIEGEVRLAVSPVILDEFQGVLGGRKFKYPVKVSRSIVKEIETLADFVVPKQKLNVVKEDPDDNMILECAVEASADYIITGDKHLLILGDYGDIRIVTPADFLALLDE